MSTKPRPPRRPRTDQPSPRLMGGIYLSWLGIVIGVVACTLVGLGWNFQRHPEGLPTGVIPLRSGVTATQPFAPTLAETPTPTAAPILTFVPEVAGSSEPGVPDSGQPESFGYGIQTRLNVNTQATVSQLKELGVGWVRYTVSWAQLEPEPDQFQWGELDGVVSAASSNDLKVLLTVSEAPGWARSVTARGKNGPPDNVQNYVRAVTMIVARYGDTINAIEVWNGENTDVSWYSPGGINPTSYLNLILPTAQAIRDANPHILIISGALTPTGRNDNISAIDDFSYMKSLIDGRLLDFVDCVGVRHPGFNLPPTLSAEDAFSGGLPPGTVFAGPYDTANPVNPHHSWSFTSTLNGVHSMIIATGKETPLCVTQFGWASAEGIGSPGPDFQYARDNSQDLQSKYMLRAFRVMHDWGFVRMAMLYNLDYASKPSGDGVDGAALYSILNASGQPRPAYLALKDMPKLP